MADVDQRTRDRYEPVWPQPTDPLALPERKTLAPWVIIAAIALGLVFLGVTLAELVRFRAGWFFVFFFFGPWMFLRRRRRR